MLLAAQQAPRFTVAPGPGLIAINHGSTFLVCDQDGRIRPHSGQPLGLYAEDTRFLSNHELRLNRGRLTWLGAAKLSYRHARWTYTSATVPADDGTMGEGRLTVTLDRTISTRRLHEDLTVSAFGEMPAALLELQLESDFADLFEVRSEQWQQRPDMTTVWTSPNRLDTWYHREDFVRRCLVRVLPGSGRVHFANGALRFPVHLSHGAHWRVCLQYDLVTSSRARPLLAPCPLGERAVDGGERLRERWQHVVARARSADLRLRQAFDQALDDFAALRLYDADFGRDVWLPAAGIPWFVAVFGRDSIIASMQAFPVHPLFAVGTLQKLAQWQATVDDPERDAEPGKICHEMRVGEWSHFHRVPHSPYYGTADATPMYLLLLAETYRWLGDARQLSRFRNTAERCLDWIDSYGDLDGDGLQEYAPRSPRGYRNQCWRDAFDGVLDEEGRNPPHPIGTCELQAYVYAAKLRVADLFAAWGDEDRAQRLRAEAAQLRVRFLDRFWLADEGILAFALDGDKRALRTTTSNPGHCLWLGILDPPRARMVADRLMQPDLFSGFGLRTLSSDHPAYDPHSYQRGSVWPHDTVIAAAGLRRYGRDADAWELIDGICAAASAFERYQLPELFAGLPRESTGVPVPYAGANAPQAWAAGSVFHSIRVLLGLEPDVPGGRIYLNPALPPWCPEVELAHVRVGDQRLHIRVQQRPGSEADIEVRGNGPLEVVRGRPSWLSDD